MVKSLELLRKPAQPQATLRKPRAEDGAAIWNLVKACKPLDENSMYCNLIQCDHFRDTCVVAEADGQVVGWVSGYMLPDDSGTLFVWQVAVSPKARGMGLGQKMLAHLKDRDACAGIERLQTTITGDNAASWALFRRFAEKQGGTLKSAPHFTEEDHFQGKHDTENMVTIDLRVQARKAA
ncbi:diaminobutyrate acetyltransferase [Rhodobacteraceae bacterium 2CG4]|uniref:L-2,4-diaminobutyric acid acetyltransferase n=1 Tax=Halovulum marinum TaxID=2662447 RepID=A0A6L5YZN1_9RHOB|nr:diaminobutyrate acetyltransferase [Halovulum marinum]MSU89332.1 diaminobutyrate acetyltransferase [Halovulum marinum]